jgi:AraC-like DNA-binding protein
MSKRVFLKKNSVAFGWIMSYVLFLLLFSATVTGIYYGTKDVVAGQIESYNALRLKRTQMGIDGLISDARNTGLQFVFNTRVEYFARLSGELTDGQYYETVNIINDIKTHKAVNNNIGNIAVIFGNIDLAVTANGATDIKTYFQTQYSGDEEKYTEWKSVFENKVSEYYNSFSYTGIDGKNNENIEYIRSVSYGDPRDLSSCVVVSIGTERLFDENSDGGEAYYILNGRGGIAASSGRIADIIPERLETGEGALHKKIGNERYVISYINSKVNKWQYVSVMPETKYMGKLNYVRNTVVLGIILMLVIGIFLTWYFMKRNYAPISKLVGIFDERDSGVSEYEFLEKSIGKALSERNALNYQLDRRNLDFFKSYLTKILKGVQRDAETIRKDLADIGVTFKSNYFCAALFSYSANNKDYKRSEAVFILTNVIEELVNRHYFGNMTELDDGLTGCLINIEDEEKITILKDDLSEITETARKFIKQNFDIDFTVSAGRVAEDISAVWVSAEEAQEVLKYRQVLGISKNLMFYDEIADLTHDNYYYPVLKEQQLINFIKTGDYGGAKEITDEFFDKNFRQSGDISLTTVQCLLTNLTTTMIRAVGEMFLGSSVNITGELDPVSRLLPCKTIGEMEAETDGFLKKLCGEVAKINSDNSNWIKNDVIPYIDKEVCNPNLNIAGTAVRFNVHPVYISRLFKEKMSIGILDYINGIRIEKAKELLKNQKTNVDETALSVGYTNVRTFTRIFKKLEGITPGKYKELL